MLLQAVGGHGAIKNKAVALRVGMVVGLLGEDEKLLLTNDGSKKASVMDMVIFRRIFFELLVFFTFTLFNSPFRLLTNAPETRRKHFNSYGQ